MGILLLDVDGGVSRVYRSHDVSIVVFEELR